MNTVVRHTQTVSTDLIDIFQVNLGYPHCPFVFPSSVPNLCMQLGQVGQNFPHRPWKSFSDICEVLSTRSGSDCLVPSSNQAGQLAEHDSGQWANPLKFWAKPRTIMIHLLHKKGFAVCFALLQSHFHRLLVLFSLQFSLDFTLDFRILTCLFIVL